jgi:hypothetical protein
MAHFAQIDESGIVLQVLVIPDDQQHRGHDYLANDLNLGGTWLQTSYNTSGGVHRNGGTPLRKNYAGIGYRYDSTRDAFIPPQPFPSWTLNETTCYWDPPVPYPAPDGNAQNYHWDEATLSWKAVLPGY